MQEQEQQAAGFKRIGTHDGKFHADEALACYMLLQLPCYKNAQIIRTRDPKILDELDIVVDVGAQYDYSRTFKETWDSEHRTTLSSAGLVYRHFGRELIPILGEKKEIKEEELELIYQKCYDDYIEGIDGVDNGIPLFTTGSKDEPSTTGGVNEKDTSANTNCTETNGNNDKVAPADPLLPPPSKRMAQMEEETKPNIPTPAYSTSSISTIINRLNPLLEHETANEQFVKAVDLIGQDFKRTVYYLVRRWLPARHVVHSALSHCKDWDGQGRILVLHAAEPWKSHLFDLETEFGVTVEYVLFPESHSTRWMIQAVPSSKDEPYANRKSFPEEWRGLRDAVLSELLGITGCVFVHNSGFIAAHETFDGALTMARRALDSQ